MSSSRLKRALEDVLCLPPDEALGVIRSNPELLTPAVDEPLAYIIDAARRDGDEDRLTRAEWLADLLRIGRRIGPEATLAAFAGDEEPEDVDTLDAAYEYWDLYRSTGDAAMLDAAVEQWQSVLAATPVDSVDYPVALNNVASGLASRYELMRSGDDLTQAIDAARQSVLATPAAALERPTRLSNLAGLLLMRFDESQNMTELDDALRILTECVDAVQSGSSERALCLTNYAGALYKRYALDRNDADLNAVIEAAEEAVALTPPGSRDYAERQHSLASGLERLYVDRGDETGLDRALNAWLQGISNRGLGAPVEITWLIGYGRALWRRYKITRDPADRLNGVEVLSPAYMWGAADAGPMLDELFANAATAYSEVGNKPLETPPELEALLERLNDAMATYRETGSLDHLDAVVRGWPIALAQPALGDRNPQQRASALHEAGQALWTRFEARDADKDMNEAIEAFEEAVELTADESPNSAPRRTNLALALSVRCARTGDLADLERARRLVEAALEMELPPDYRASIGRVYAIVLTQTASQCADQTAAVSMLEQEVDFLGEVLGDLADASPERMPTAFALAAARLELYDRTRVVQLLNDVIADLDELLPQAVPGQEELQGLISLARALMDRYNALGGRDDLERAVTMLEHAVDAAAGSPLEPALLEELGLARLNRAAALDRLSDIERAVNVLTTALEAAAPESLQHYERLGCLGVAQLTHARRTGDEAELSAAVELLRLAADRLPTTSPRRALVLRVYADTHRLELEAARGESDANAAVKALEEAGALAPNDPNTVVSLGRVLLERYALTGRRKSLDQALDQFHRSAGQQVNPQFQGFCLVELGRAYVERYRLDHDAADRAAAVAAFRRALELTGEADSTIALHAAQLWAGLEVEDKAWLAAAEPYRLGLDALARLLRAPALRAERELWLRDARGFAAAAAIDFSLARDTKSGVVALEQNRVLLLTEALRREQIDLEQLRLDGFDELAAEYERAADQVAELERAEIAGGEHRVGERRRARSSLADEVARTRTTLDGAIRDIRSVPGYFGVFETATFDEIVAFAGDTPIVYITPGSPWGSAFVVNADAPPPILLPNLSTDRAIACTRYYLDAYEARADDPDRWRDQLDLTLEWLWDAALGPLLSLDLLSDLYLGNQVVDRARPLVLVPVGILGLLPLHAAWTADENAPAKRRYALDDLCLTYAPNARLLAQARDRLRHASSTGLLAVDEPLPVAAGRLPGAAAEVAAAARAIRPATTLHHEDATVERVLEELPANAFAHFACHGRADPEEPLDSFLLLANDGRLTLREIMEQHLTGLRLAVLSACETAVVGAELPDEVVSLPTGLLSAGVGGVIASAWAVPDTSTALLLSRFYSYLEEEPDAIPAEALRRAQQWVRDSSNGEKLEQMPDLMSAAADHVPERGRRLWENAHGHRHPHHWAGFAYVGA